MSREVDCESTKFLDTESLHLNNGVCFGCAGGDTCAAVSESAARPGLVSTSTLQFHAARY